MKHKDEKKKVSKKAIKVALAMVKKGQKKKKAAKKAVSAKVKKQSTLRTRQTTKAKSVRKSDAAMIARKKKFMKKN